MSLSFQIPIVLVDDSRVSLLVADKMVRNCGFVNTHMSRFDSALEVIRNLVPCIVMSDLLMPTVKEGIRLVDSIRHDYPKSEVPILIMSSSRYQEHIEEVITRGVNDYLIKPLSEEALAPKLWHYAGTLKSRDERNLEGWLKEKRIKPEQAQACQSYLRRFDAGKVPILVLAYWLGKLTLPDLIKYLERFHYEDVLAHDHLSELGWSETQWQEMETARQGLSLDPKMILSTIYDINIE
ncbi:MAG: response regulator [Acidobacteria bacterium]|nr:response regulator [Acidobacteriota bacterium]